MIIGQASVIVVLLCVGGCAISSDRHARQLADNRADDEYCVDHGLHYPDPGYTQCRRQLVDRRLYRDWQNLLSLQQTDRPTVDPGQVPPPSFRSPDPSGFHCHAEPQFGNDYVFCGYDNDVSDSR